MAILMKMEAPGATLEQYDKLNELMGTHSEDNAPDGLIIHVAGQTDDGVMVIDVWESEEKLNAFFENQLGAALAETGIETGKPTILQVHNRIPRGQGTEPNVIVEIEVDAGPDVYDELVARMPTHVNDGSGHPVYTHTAAITEDGGMYVVDLWESPERFGQFAAEELGPAAGDRLGEVQPKITPVHNVIHGKAAVSA